MKDKQILVVTTSFPISHDGSESAGAFVNDFTESLSQTSNISIVYPSDKPETFKQPPDGHYPFPVSSLPLSVINLRNPLSLFLILKILKSGNSAVSRAIKERPPDHILALWALPSGYWARKAAKKLNVNYSVWCLGSDIWSLSRIPLVKSYLASVLADSDIVFADGYSLSDDITRLYPKPVTFLPSARKLSSKGTKKIATTPPYILGFLGRWHINKGIDLLLDAMSVLPAKAREKIKCLRIAGGGNMEKLVKKKVQLLKSQGIEIEISGFLNSTEAADFLNSIDYLIIPSRKESIPVIFSDAMQSSNPVAVFPIGDFPRLFQNSQPGVIAKNVSADALAEAIDNLTNNPPASYAPVVSNVSKTFSVDHSAKEFLKHTFNKTIDI